MLGKDRVCNTLMIMNMITMVILAIIILEVVVLISGLLSLFVELGDYVNAEKIFLSLRFSTKLLCSVQDDPIKIG